MPTGGKGVWRIPKDGGTASPVAGLETFTASAVLSDEGCIYARGKAGETDHVLRVAYPKD